jgi:hypothetical protein
VSPRRRQDSLPRPVELIDPEIAEIGAIVEAEPILAPPKLNRVARDERPVLDLPRNGDKPGGAAALGPVEIEAPEPAGTVDVPPEPGNTITLNGVTYALPRLGPFAAISLGRRFGKWQQAQQTYQRLLESGFQPGVASEQTQVNELGFEFFGWIMDVFSEFIPEIAFSRVSEADFPEVFAQFIPFAGGALRSASPPGPNSTPGRMTQLENRATRRAKSRR